MNHIGPKRIPYVSSFSCSSTGTSASPATWSAIASADRSSVVACWSAMCLGLATGGRPLAISPHWLQEGISEAIGSQAGKCVVCPEEG